MRSFIWSFAGALALAGAYMIAQPPPQPPFGELALPVYSVPPTCDTGRAGRLYYDSDDNLVYWCNGTAWTSFSSLTISGTNPYLARFTLAGTNIETSEVRNTGIPAAGASGDIVDIKPTINNMDGTDTVHLFEIGPGNTPNHTGASNVLRGIFIDFITADADATETALGISNGWDLAIQIDGLATRFLADEPAAGSSGDLMELVPLPNNMNGGDTVNMIDLAPNTASVNHTGVNNVFTALNIGTLTADADALEIAIKIFSGWDHNIYMVDAATIADFYWADGSVDVQFDSADTTTQYTFKGNGTAFTVLQDAQELTHLMGTDLAVVGANQTVDPNGGVVSISAGGAASVSIITAPVTASFTERVTFVCDGANVTFNDADAAGAAGTLNLAGAATNFTCSGDDTITFVYLVAPTAGNARWVEVARSVN